MKRNTFLRTAALGMIAGTLAPAKIFSSTIREFYVANGLAGSFPPPGVQLYTFFGKIDNDVEGTLKQIADLGYREIESAFSLKGGFYGMKAAAFRKLNEDLGLTWKSHHVIGAPFHIPKNAKILLGADGKPITLPAIKNLRDNYKQIIDELAESKIEYLVCANSPTGTLAEVHGTIEVLNKSAEYASRAGLKFCYHNHDAEFKAIEGKTPYDLLLAGTDVSMVKMELDLAWATKAGVNVVELFRKHPGRFPLWHVKDISADFETVLPVGTGVVKFSEIFAQAQVSGLKYFFVEHDGPKDPLASITTSMANLKKIESNLSISR